MIRGQCRGDEEWSRWDFSRLIPRNRPREGEGSFGPMSEYDVTKEPRHVSVSDFIEDSHDDVVG